MADKQATFGIKVRAESDANLAKASVEQLRKEILASQEAVKNYGGALRNLRGTSEEVAEAKKRLKGALDDERARISQATIALGKQGTTLAEVTEQANAAAKAQKEAAKAAAEEAKEAKRVAQEEKRAADSTRKLQEEARKLREQFLQTYVFDKAVSVARALGEVALDTATKITRFTLESANLLRTQNLLREAATGSASNAAALGHQIDALADKVPTARDELQKLALETSRAFVGSRVSGQGLVDVMGAIAQANAAGMGEAASSFRAIADRGKLTGFTGLNPLETQGKGFAFQDVAAQLSSSLGQPIAKVNQLLLYGRVRVDDMAAALKKVAENKWADINRRQMLDLNVQWQKLKDNLVRLTSSVNLEPILKAVARLGRLFSDDTVNGVALRELFKGFGVILGAAFTKGGLTAEKFIKQVTIAALKLEIEILKNRKAIGEWVDKAVRNLPSIETGFYAVKVAVVALTGVLAAMAIAGAVAFAPFVAAGAIAAEFYAIVTQIKQIDWGFLWDNMAKGWKRVVAGIKEVGKNIVNLIKHPIESGLEIQSPSRVFQRYGQHVAKGFEKGVDIGAPGAQKSVGALAQPKAIAPGALAARGATLNGGVNVNLHFPNAKDGKDIQAAIAGPGFRAQLTQAIEDVLSGAGIPTQQPAGG